MIAWILVFPFFGLAQESQVKMRIYLVGDAGETKNGYHPVLDDLKSRLQDEQIPTTHLIYLGDNIYPLGMPDIDDESRVESELVLRTQLNLFSSLSGKTWMVPGNHDWKRGRADGMNAILRAQEFVKENYPPEKVQWVPEDACPGPVAVSLNENTLLVLMDSQWWLHSHEKPGKESGCTNKTKEELIEALSNLLAENHDKVILFAMHHPMRSYGPHNGGFTWKDHVFPLYQLHPALYIPLPIIGSIYPLYRTWFGGIQDIPNPKYQGMIASLDSIFTTHSNVIDVAGHEHGLFYTREGSLHYIVSGAGAKNTAIRNKNAAEFTYSEQGYAYLDFYEDKRIVLGFLSPRDKKPLFEAVLIR